MTTKLISAAREAALRAYAPYSGFRVGAAVELTDGTIITGNNQENSSYPLGMCAERVAIGYAKSLYPDVAIRRVVIVSSSTDAEVSPCGGCRQVMAEAVARQGSDFEVIMVGSAQTVSMTVAELLPLAFSL